MSRVLDVRVRNSYVLFIIEWNIFAWFNLKFDLIEGRSCTIHSVDTQINMDRIVPTTLPTRNE